jgi:class 3 adenylate cyclase
MMNERWRSLGDGIFNLKGRGWVGRDSGLWVASVAGHGSVAVFADATEAMAAVEVLSGWRCSALAELHSEMMDAFVSDLPQW